MLSTGGFLVTGAANIFNQILERESDLLMSRTANRPVAAKRITPVHALLSGVVMAAVGILLLWRINNLCALFGFVALAVYVGAYTPLKNKTSLSVVPGAISGSMPVLIGCVAGSGSITTGAVILYLLQFIWQFPHTWSIAWLLKDEYDKAGIKLLPNGGKQGKSTAMLIMASTFLMIPAGLLLYMYNTVGSHICWVLCMAALVLCIPAIQLYYKHSRKWALRLMFGSIIYLPLLLILLVIEKYLL
jgi:protoheme IX farnesyltransferase